LTFSVIIHCFDADRLNRPDSSPAIDNQNRQKCEIIF
jgi:hypothetical protein